jgi:hypothetical protein
MERQTKPSQAEQHDIVKQKYDEVQSDGAMRKDWQGWPCTIIIAKIR